MIKEEDKKLVAQDAAAEYWHWLGGVWEEYSALSGYVRDSRTFGNSVWDSGVERALISFTHKLMHYPEQTLKNFGKDFERESSKLRTEAFLNLMQINISFLKSNRSGMVTPTDLLGEMMIKLNDLGHQKRRERMLAGVR